MNTPASVATPTNEERNEKDMPRTKGSKNKAKVLTIDEQIKAAEARVADCKEKWEAAKAELNALETLRDEAAMKELMAAIAGKGMSVADVLAMIKGSEGEA